MSEHTREAVEHIDPIYPVDVPPTYRARCSCGWRGPERYYDAPVDDFARHVQHHSP